MADVSHELGSLRHIVDKPLSSKVAMFNKVADQHNASQLLNPFSNENMRAGSPRPTFSKDEYGKPLAGSLTEMRGQKANIHVCKEMLELCQVIDNSGFANPEEPELRVIFFGDLFNIYNHISDKCVGLLLRARKHKLVDFEGEMLFQRRDDEVPIFTTQPIKDIRRYLENKQEEFRRSVSPAPQATSVIQDRLKRSASHSPAPVTKPASPLGPKAISPLVLDKSSIVTPIPIKPEPVKAKPEATKQVVHKPPTQVTISINKPEEEKSKAEASTNSAEKKVETKTEVKSDVKSVEIKDDNAKSKESSPKPKEITTKPTENKPEAETPKNEETKSEPTKVVAKVQDESKPVNSEIAKPVEVVSEKPKPEEIKVEQPKPEPVNSEIIATEKPKAQQVNSEATKPVEVVSEKPKVEQNTPKSSQEPQTQPQVVVAKPNIPADSSSTKNDTQTIPVNDGQSKNGSSTDLVQPAEQSL